jgi:hypothetical protein
MTAAAVLPKEVPLRLVLFVVYINGKQVLPVFLEV